jgi:glycosyltransferase A (GT-A) superfamily protein (DUF2064 family)
MSSAAPAVLIMVRAPRRGKVRRALEPVLGQDGCLELHRALIATAVRWAHEVAAEGVFVAHEPADAGPELQPLVREAVVFPQSGEGIAARVADAAGRVFTERGGPLLIVWPELPAFRPEHAVGALGDLGAGCDVVLGPVIDGGLYLLGIPRLLAKLFTLPEDAWRSSDVMVLAIAAAREAGLEIGVLRAERGLQQPADVRSALADPLLPKGIAAILSRSSGSEGAESTGHMA